MFRAIENRQLTLFTLFNNFCILLSTFPLVFFAMAHIEQNHIYERKAAVGSTFQKTLNHLEGKFQFCKTLHLWSAWISSKFPNDNSFFMARFQFPARTFWRKYASNETLISANNNDVAEIS